MLKSKSTLQSSVLEWWQNQKTEHVQANISTLPSGGGLPLGNFALITRGQAAGSLLGSRGLTAVKKEVIANILQFYLFVCPSPLSHVLVFSHLLFTSPLAC